MKNLLTFAAWLAGVALLLLLTAHFTLRHALNTRKFRTALTGFIERTTGRAADYERIDYTLSPFSLVVRKAALKEADRQQDFLTVGSFSAVIDFPRKEISALLLDQPSLRIVQRPDGSFNFSDLVPAPSSAPTAGQAPAAPPAEMPSAPVPLPTAEPAPPPAPPRFSVRLLRIDNARLEFARLSADGSSTEFTVSNLDFLLRDFAMDKPLRMEGSATIGKSSALQFEVSGPALAPFAADMGTWPLSSGGRLDIRDFADVKSILPADMPPFHSLWLTWNIQGTLADKLSVLVNLQTPEATDMHPLGLEAGLDAEVSWPGPLVQHVLVGAPLPEDLRFAPPPCQPPPGSVVLTAHPLAALLLKHAQATGQLSVPRAAHGRNRFEGGTATFYLRSGVLTVPRAAVAAYGGDIEARGNVQLLACPLSYRLDRLVATDIAIEQAMAANRLDEFADVSGRLHLEASAEGRAVGSPEWRMLEADARAHIAELQSIGPGGSLMDQVWRQLDNPLLLKLVPRLKSKVAQARQSADIVTTSRYDEAAMTLSLRNGTATLSEARLAMPGYRLDLSGTIRPCDDQLDLAARLLASPAETALLTGGQDLSAYLPYENGGLAIPFFIRSPLQDPQIRPDLDRLLQNAVGGATVEDLGSQLIKTLGVILNKP